MAFEPRAKTVYDTLTDSSGFLASIVDKEALENLISRHLHREEDATDRLWRLLNLQLWGDLFLTGRPERWWKGMMPAEPSLDAIPAALFRPEYEDSLGEVGLPSPGQPRRANTYPRDVEVPAPASRNPLRSIG